MALSLLSVRQRTSTRIRIGFDGALAAGAFGTAGLAIYGSAESYDGSSVAARSWAVTGAYAIASDPTAVELVLGAPVSDGSWFWVTFAASVPAVSGGPFVGTVSPTIRTGEEVPSPSPEVPTTDIDAILWGEDLVFDGKDFVESAEGDLLSSSGIQNAIEAGKRRLLSEGLAWDPSYGLKPRRFVDAPEVLAPAICGEAQAQATQDDRVVAAASKVGDRDPNDPSTVIIDTTVTFFNGQSATVSSPIGGARA